MIHFKTQLIISYLILFSIHDGALAQLQVCIDELNTICKEIVDVYQFFGHYIQNLKEGNYPPGGYPQGYTRYLYKFAILNDVLSLQEFITNNPDIYSPESAKILLDNIEVYEPHRSVLFLQMFGDINTFSKKKIDFIKALIIIHFVANIEKLKETQNEEEFKEPQDFLDKIIILFGELKIPQNEKELKEQQDNKIKYFQEMKDLLLPYVNYVVKEIKFIEGTQGPIEWCKKNAYSNSLKL